MQTHIAVIGAGPFGGWTALMLLRRGYQVTLFDAWGAGNSLSSSGDEHRIIRSVYGDSRLYSTMALRSLELWRENQRGFGKQILFPVGVLNLVQGDVPRLTNALPILSDLGIHWEHYTTPEAKKKYPHINFEDLDYAVVEHGAGYLLARMGCIAVAEAFVQEGGTYQKRAVAPPTIQHQELEAISLSDGSTFRADQYVFACGSWLGRMFPKEIGTLIRPTRQEVFYFAPPPGSTILQQTPVWLDYGSLYPGKLFYGIPAHGSDAEARGFKLGEDTLGADFNPDTEDRLTTALGYARAKQYLEHRFPSMKDQPLGEARVCHYENSPDAHLIMDRLPSAKNVWIAGGGSGHGYKHGPAIGEIMADLIDEKGQVEPLCSFARFAFPTEKVDRR